MKSILMHEYRHNSTRVHTNQHESDTSQHESTRFNTNQYESDTSQHDTTEDQHQSKRDNQIKNLSYFIVVWLVEYDNSLIGLNITFSHQLEQVYKENQKSIGQISRCSKFCIHELKDYSDKPGGQSKIQICSKIVKEQTVLAADEES